MTTTNPCIFCGEEMPEGMMVCRACERAIAVQAATANAVQPAKERRRVWWRKSKNNDHAGVAREEAVCTR